MSGMTCLVIPWRLGTCTQNSVESPGCQTQKLVSAPDQRKPAGAESMEGEDVPILDRASRLCDQYDDEDPLEDRFLRTRTLDY